jgi:hypothetical protein
MGHFLAPNGPKSAGFVRQPPCKGGAEQRFAEHGSGSGAVGYRVRVESVEGLTLRVRPIAEENGEEGEGVAAEETVEKEGAR